MQKLYFQHLLELSDIFSILMLQGHMLAFAPKTDCVVPAPPLATSPSSTSSAPQQQQQEQQELLG